MHRGRRLYPIEFIRQIVTTLQTSLTVLSAGGGYGWPPQSRAGGESHYVTEAEDQELEAEETRNHTYITEDGEAERTTYVTKSKETEMTEVENQETCFNVAENAEVTEDKNLEGTEMNPRRGELASSAHEGQGDVFSSSFEISPPGGDEEQETQDYASSSFEVSSNGENEEELGGVWAPPAGSISHARREPPPGAVSIILPDEWVERDG